MFFPIQGDSNWEDVVLALPMDGENNSTSFTDISFPSKIVTRTGDTKISTTLGYPAAYFDASGDFLTVTSHADFEIGTGDFTAEAYIYIPDLSAQYVFLIMDTRPISTNGACPCLGFMSNGSLSYYFNGDNRITSANGVIQANSLQHLAVCRASGVTRMFVDGVQRGSDYINSLSISQERWVIGGDAYFGLPSFTGYIRDWYLARYAKYIANFTPTPARSFLLYGKNKRWLNQPLQQTSFIQTAQRGL